MEAKIDPNSRKRGRVKGVPSGDTVILQGNATKEGVPLEKTIRLNGINAPRIGDLDKPEEPFAFEAREYLRKKLIGQEVHFYIESKFNEREFGRVTLNDEDVAIGVLSQGYAKLHEEMKNKPVNFAQYKEATDEAQKRSKGIFGSSEKSRKLQKIENPKKILDKYKGTKLRAIVEDVKNALFVLYIPDLETILKLSLSSIFVQIANFKASQDVRTFIESKFLSREVNVIINSYDEKKEFYFGSVQSLEDPNYDLAYELVKNGYAKLNNSSVTELEAADFKKIKAAQDEAQKQKLRIWSEYEDKKGTSSTTQTETSFSGKVIEVHSGDCLSVETPKGDILRLNLSNVRAPAIGNPKRGDLAKPWALEAKELVRHLAIGKKVKVEVEFTKKIAAKLEVEEEKADSKPKAPIGEERTMTFGTIILPNDKNLSVLLAEAGLATVSIPRAEDDFTQHLKALKDAEDAAKEKKLGQWSNNKALTLERFTDYAGPKMAVKAKTFYEFIKGESRIKGVVDAVLSGSLFKIRIDERNCFILFSLAGLRTLQADKNIAQYEEFAKKALAFTKEHAGQRDVELDVVSVSPKGLFQGGLYINKKNYGHFLLESGLAYAEAANKNEQRFYNENKEIEKAAQAKKVGLWGANVPIQTNSRLSNLKVVSETKTVTVVEAYDNNEIYVQYADDAKALANLANELKSFKSDTKLEQPVKKGTPCVAKFSDGLWYRARVEKASDKDQYSVFFTDYGNTETVHYNDIRKITNNLLSVPALAKKCALAFVNGPGAKTVTYEDLTEVIPELLYNKKFTAQFVYEDNATRYCVLTEKSNGGIKDSINYKLVADGLVRIDDVTPMTPEQETALKDAEETAKDKRKGGWKEGDFGDDDEEF